MNEDRAAFERHAKSLGYSVDPDTRPGREGGYWSSHTHLMWQTWQAALAEPVEPVRCPLCNYQYGHQIGCENNPLDIALAAAAQSRQPAEPVQEPVAKVELMTTGGNAGLATRIVEIDDHLRERLRPGQLLYTAPPQRPAQPVQEPASKMTAGRAAYFMARFKREEKMLGPNEQAALDFVISMLEAALAEPVQEPDPWGAGYEAGYRAGVAEYDPQQAQQALSEADRIMGHDDEATEWRNRWAHLFQGAAEPPKVAAPE